MLQSICFFHFIEVILKHVFAQDLVSLFFLAFKKVNVLACESPDWAIPKRLLDSAPDAVAPFEDDGVGDRAASLLSNDHFGIIGPSDTRRFRMTGVFQDRFGRLIACC